MIIKNDRLFFKCKDHTNPSGRDNEKESKKYKNQRWAALNDLGILPVFFLKKLLK